MDSLKIPNKGGSQNSSPNNGKQASPSVPIAVRFNANAERIDDIFNQPPNQNNTIAEGGGNNVNTGGGGGGDSLSSSPSQPPQQQSPQPTLSQNVDDANARNFLQGNFFNRKSGMPGKQQLSPNSACPPADAAPTSPASPGANTGVFFNGSQPGSGGVSPNSALAISPNKNRAGPGFHMKGGSSPTDVAAAQNAMGALNIGNGNKWAGISGGGGGDVPFLGPGFVPDRMVGNGMDMRPMDHCFGGMMRPINSGGGDASNMAERMRKLKMSEHHLSEADAVATASGNGAAGFLEGGLKLNSPSRSPTHSQGAENQQRYSRKVFVGGLPPDIDEDEITTSFRRFGPLVVDWPHKAESKSYFPPKGYAFLLFQDEHSVQQLIDSCITDDDKLYLCVSSPTIKDKPVQIRPWRLTDADYVLDATMSLDPRKTVFVGGVPRPLKAYELAMIMDRLYGGVCYAGIDTDPELKYPKGAGRVAFSNQQSYISAISARFVQLQHGDIDKPVEVKPYVLDDQMCDECEGQRCSGKFAPFFCANVTCLQYYCEHCWAVIHSRPGRENHKPLVKEGADRPRAVPFRWC